MSDFIRRIVEDDLVAGRVQQVITRFPPEPNGVLHIGHAKAVLLNYSIAKEFGGIFRLRYDDTNPEKEREEFVRDIEEDLRWIGCVWEGEPRYASDYFEPFYQWAQELVKEGKAYVDSQKPEEIVLNRGTPTQAGVDSPYRNRGVEENLTLLEKMKAGKCAEGECVLRAKISMNHVNILMRDPIIYRIRKERHHRTGNKWCIYPMYDFAHGYEDAIEGVSHSLCSLEFENHRPLYDWFLDNISAPSRPRQYEFARLNLSYTVVGKRHLRQLIEKNYVTGWNDPRMPTLRGMRRRGFTPESIRRFISEIGVGKANSLVDIEFLYFIIREELNATAPRRMAVLNPIKLTITNWPEGKIESFMAENNPENLAAGSREVQFSGKLWVERDDYLDNPPRKWFRMAPGKEVRLKHTYCITVTDVLYDPYGLPQELLCTYDPQTRGGETSDGRKVRGAIHWLSRHNAVSAEVRLYEHLFIKADMGKLEEDKTITDYINNESAQIMSDAKVEPSLAAAQKEERFQFLRNGYFVADKEDHVKEIAPVFNRIVKLRDNWTKIAGNLSNSRHAK